jgi:hypothetical protein
VCIAGLEKLKNLISNHSEVTETIYYEAIGLCAGAMYVFVPQGRIKGVRSMTMAMASVLFDDGSSFTSDFKTEAEYHFQPLLGTPEVKVFILSILNLSNYLSIYLTNYLSLKEILAFFIEKIRGSLEVSYPYLRQPSSFLFASKRNPNKAACVGKHLKSFFMLNAGDSILYSIYN